MKVDTRVSGLPVPRTALIGRERDLAQLLAMCLHPATRLLTLTGVGGAGKTQLAVRLGVELAPRFPHRVWLVELAAVSDPALVQADRVGIGESDHEVEPSWRGPWDIRRHPWRAPGRSRAYAPPWDDGVSTSPRALLIADRRVAVDNPRTRERLPV